MQYYPHLIDFKMFNFSIFVSVLNILYNDCTS